MRKPIDGFPNLSREFLSVMDKARSVKLILADFTGDGCEARFVETLFDEAGLIKRGVRIEIIYWGEGDIDPDFLDTLFTQGMRYEVLMRSAMRNSRRAANTNAVNRNAVSVGDFTGRSVKRASVNRSSVSDAQALAILGL